MSNLPCGIPIPYGRIVKRKYIFMEETPKIEEKVKSFFEAFEKLSGDDKLFFLAEIDKVLSKKDDKERQLFLALIKAAREGKSCEEAVADIKKVKFGI